MSPQEFEALCERIQADAREDGIAEGRAQAFKEAAEIARWHQIELRPGVRVIDADALVAAIEAAAKGQSQ